MDLSLWFAFVGACAVVLIIPGPTVFLVVSYALTHGRKTVPATVAGVALGDFVAMTTSMLGLGVILAASAEVFTALKIVGALYLVWLGIGMWRSKPSDDDFKVDTNGGTDAGSSQVSKNGPSNRKMFVHAFVVTALNPKSIVFFVAFLPQFLDPAQSYWSQVIVLETTFLILASSTALTYAVLAARLNTQVRRPEVRRWVNRVGGSLLIGAGALTATMKRV